MLGVVLQVVVAAAIAERIFGLHKLRQSLHRPQRFANTQQDSQRDQISSATETVPAVRDVQLSVPADVEDRTHTVLAELDIPRLNIAVPVLEGTDWLTLNHAVGHIAGTAYPGEPGNIAIAGHRDTFFRGLKDIRSGDRIELLRKDGTDTYSVDQIQIVSPNDVSVLRRGAAPSLTLVTCYPFYFVGSAPKRFIVTASPATQTDAGSAVNPNINQPSL